MKGDLEKVPANANKQKQVVIKERVKGDKQHVYTALNIDSLTHAMADLTHGKGLEVWLYLVKNQQGYKSELSSKDAKNNFGIAEKRFQAGVNELIEKGYLNYIKTPYGNSWEFIEYPGRAVDPSSKTDEGVTDTNMSQEDPSSKSDEGGSSKMDEGVHPKQMEGPSKLDEGSIQNGRTNITYTTDTTLNTTIENNIGESSSSSGACARELAQYPSSEESSKEQKEEEKGSEEIEVVKEERPAVPQVQSATEHVIKLVIPSETAIPTDKEPPKAPIKPKSIGYMRRSRIESDPTIHFALDTYQGIEGAWIWKDGDRVQEFKYFTPEH